MIEKENSNKFIFYNYKMSDDSYEEESWVEWFINIDGHQFLCEVDEDFIRDSFNLYGLQQHFDHYKL
jgi:casein kinase II subunit beta